MANIPTVGLIAATSKTLIPVSSGSNRISDRGPKPPVYAPSAPTVVTDTQSATVIIPGKGNLIVNLSGISFYFYSITSAKGIQARAINAGQTRSLLNFVQGTGLRLGTTGFQSVELINPDAGINGVTIVVGGGIPDNTYDEFIDKRVIIANTSVAIKAAPTVAVAFKTRVPGWGDLLGAGATQDVADGYLGMTRHSVVFSNNDNANVLTVFDTAGNILGTVQPSTAFYLETSGDIQLHNPAGGAVACNIGEVYYT